MKAAELHEGTDYAVRQYGSLYRFRLIRVEEASKTTYNGRSYRGKTTVRKMALMHRLNSDGAPSTMNPVHVEFQQIECDWATHVAAADRRKAADATWNEHLAAIEQRANDLLGTTHLIGFARGDGHYIARGTAVISSSTLAKLLDAAFAAGQESVR